MSTSYPGTSGPSGNAGSRPAHGQRAGGKHATPEPMLTQLRQSSQERFVSNQFKKLDVRFLFDIFDLKINRLLGGTRTPSKASSETYPTASRAQVTWEATSMLRSRLNSGVTLKALLSIAKRAERLEPGQ